MPKQRKQSLNELLQGLQNTPEEAIAQSSGQSRAQMFQERLDNFAQKTGPASFSEMKQYQQDLENYYSAVSTMNTMGFHGDLSAPLAAIRSEADKVRQTMSGYTDERSYNEGYYYPAKYREANKTGLEATARSLQEMISEKTKGKKTTSQMPDYSKSNNPNAARAWLATAGQGADPEVAALRQELDWIKRNKYNAYTDEEIENELNSVDQRIAELRQQIGDKAGTGTSSRIAKQLKEYEKQQAALVPQQESRALNRELSSFDLNHQNLFYSYKENEEKINKATTAGKPYLDHEYERVPSPGGHTVRFRIKGTNSFVTDKEEREYAQAVLDYEEFNRFLRERYADREDGEAMAKSMKDHAERAYNAAKMDEKVRKAQDFAVSHEVLASLASVPLNLVSGAGFVDKLAQGITAGIDPLTGRARSIDVNRGVSQVGAIASTYRETIAAELGEHGTVGQIGGFLYQTAMSIADFMTPIGAAKLVGTAGKVIGAAEKAGKLAGGIVDSTTFLLGGAAANQTFSEAKARGATDNQALMLGVTAGIAETFFEKVSLENLKTFTSVMTTADQYGLREALVDVAKQSFVEGSEEVATTLANTVADAIIMGDKSGVNQDKLAYMRQGYSEEEATRLAWTKWVGQLGLDGLAGALSGFVISGAATGGYQITNRSLGEDLVARGEAQQVLNSGLKLEEGTEARKIAENLVSRLDAAKENSEDLLKAVSPTEYGRLYRVILKQQRDEMLERVTKQDENVRQPVSYEETLRRQGAEAAHLAESTHKVILQSEGNGQPEVAVQVSSVAEALYEAGDESMSVILPKARLLEKVIAGEKITDEDFKNADIYDPVMAATLKAFTGIDIDVTSNNVRAAYRDAAAQRAEQLAKIGETAGKVQEAQDNLAAAETRNLAAAQAGARAMMDAAQQEVEAGANLAQPEPAPTTPDSITLDDGNVMTRSEFAQSFRQRFPNAAVPESTINGMFDALAAEAQVNGGVVARDRIGSMIKEGAAKIAPAKPNAPVGEPAAEPAAAPQNEVQPERKKDRKEIQNELAKRGKRIGDGVYFVESQREGGAKEPTFEQKWSALFAYAYLKKLGFTGIIFDGDACGGKTGSFSFVVDTDGVITLNPDNPNMTARQVIMLAIGHEVLHPATNDTKGRDGKVIRKNETAEDLIAAIQSLAEKGYLKGELNKQARDLERTRRRRTENYIEYLTRYEGRSEEEARAEANEHYINQEIASDWIGMIFRNQQMMERLAGVKPSLMTRIMRSLNKMRNGSAINVLSGNGNARERRAAEAELGKIMDDVRLALDHSKVSAFKPKTEAKPKKIKTGARIRADERPAREQRVAAARAAARKGEKVDTGVYNSNGEKPKRSAEMQAVMDRLARGEKVSLEEVNALPEVAEVLARPAVFTIDDNSPERIALRNKIIEQIWASGSYSESSAKKAKAEKKPEVYKYTNPVTRGHRADIVLGVPAAGKSSVLVDPLSKANGSRILDADMAKELLPEFDNGKGAGNVHEESSLIRREILKRALPMGDNIVWPMVGDSLGGLISKIETLKQAGYEVYIHLNELDAHKALGRALGRFTGDSPRFVKPDIVLKAGNKPSENYEIIKAKEGLIDGYSKYSNDVEKGHPAKLLEVSDAGRVLGQHDERRADGVVQSRREGYRGDERGVGPDRGTEESPDRRGRQDSGRAAEGRSGRAAPREDVASQRSNDGQGHLGVHAGNLSPEIRAIADRVGVVPNLGLAPADYAAFSAALDAGKAANPNGAMVDSKSVEDLTKSNAKVFLDPSGLAGVAVEEDGNIVGVFKHPDLHTNRASFDMLLTALENGGDHLDCYVIQPEISNRNLAKVYTQAGFEPVAFLRFNREYADPDWDYERFGEPDVVMWVHNGDSLETVAEKMGSYPDIFTPEYIRDNCKEFTDYGKAISYQKEQVKTRTAQTSEEAGAVSDSRQMYLGENSATADLAALDVAKEMEHKGTDSEQIRLLTGWFRGEDNKWRYEISDDRMTFHPKGSARIWNDYPEYREFIELERKFINSTESPAFSPEEQARFDELRQVYEPLRREMNKEGRKRIRNGTAHLDDIIVHPELFEAYPDLRAMRVQMTDLGPRERDTLGQFDRTNNLLQINTGFPGWDHAGYKMRTTLMHEVQHAVQSLAGHARGGNPGAWAVRKREAARQRRYYEEQLARMPGNYASDFRAWKRAYSASDKARMAELENANISNGVFRKAVENYSLEHDPRDPYALYQDTAGEREARDTAARTNYNEKQRQKEKPNSKQPLRGEKPVFSETRFMVDPEVLEKSYAPTFFSKLLDVLNNTKQEKLGAASVIPMLKGKGVKDEEIKWSGVEEFLSGKKSVSRDELAQFVQGSMIQIEEETLWSGRTGEKNAPFVDSLTGQTYESFEEAYSIALDWAEHEGYDEDDVRIESDSDEWWCIYAYNPERGETVLVDALSLAVAQPDYENGETRWAPYTLDGGRGYREMLFRVPSIGRGYTNDAMRTHWGQSDVLAHARVQDFSTNGGDNVLLIEEIQSDWHNAGRQRGYVEKGKNPSAKLRSLINQREALREKMEGLDPEDRELGDTYMDQFVQVKDEIEYEIEKLHPDLVKQISDKVNELKSGELGELIRRIADAHYTTPEVIRLGVTASVSSRNELLSWLRYPEIITLTESETEKLLRWAGEYDGLTYELDQIRAGDLNETPDAPFRDTYHEYVLKRLLREAAESGYDYLAWTTAQQQADRWSEAYMEGYRIEYDQDIPKFLKKYGKKWGATVRDISLDENGEVVHAIDITPEMGQSVLYEGQPRFMINPNFEATVDAWNKGGRKESKDFIIGATGPVLQQIGVTLNGIRLRSDKVRTIMEAAPSSSDTNSGHPEVGIKDIKAIPEILENPVLVLASRNLTERGVERSGQSTRIIVIGERKSRNGLPLMVVLDVRPGGGQTLHTVSTAYTKQRYFDAEVDSLSRPWDMNELRKLTLWGDYKKGFDFIKGSDVLYVDEKRAASVLGSTGFPSMRSKDGKDIPIKLLRSGPIGKISQFHGAVKIEGVPFDDVIRRPTGQRWMVDPSIFDTDDFRMFYNEMFESRGYTAEAAAADASRRTATEVSRVASNTYRHSDLFNRTERLMDGLRQQDLTYDVIHEITSMRNAKARLDADFDGEYHDLLRRDFQSGEDVDTAMGILSVLIADARQTGDYTQVKDMARTIQEQGTRAGQFVQSFAKYNRTPEGVLLNAADALDEAGVSPEDAEDILDRLAEFSDALHAIQRGQEGFRGDLIDLIVRQAGMRNTRVSRATMKHLGEQRIEWLYDAALNQMDMIAKDYIKPSAAKGLATYQTISHLFNIKTAARNVVSNTVFSPLAAIGNNFALIPDAVVSLFTGNRYVGLDRWIFSRNTWQGLREGANRAQIEVALDIQPEPTQRDKYGTSRRTWKMTSGPAARVGSTFEKMMGYELNWTDEYHKGAVRAEIMRSLQPMIRSGVITHEQAQEWAEQEALYRAFQDDTLVGGILAGLKGVFNMVGVGHTGRYIGHAEIKEFGLGDLIQKYTLVPGALFTRAVEFSPVGYVKSIGLMARMISNYNATKAPRARLAAAESAAAREPDRDALAKRVFRARAEVERAEMEAAQSQRLFALSVGRATTGTGLIAALAMLAFKGILRRADDEDDKNAKALHSAEGISGTQINVSALARWLRGESVEWQEGDELHSVEYLEPLNSTMAIATLIAKDAEKDETFMQTFKKHSLLNNINGLYQAFTELPTMQTLQSIQQTTQYWSAEESTTGTMALDIPIEVAKGSITGFIPSPIRQISQAADPYYRDAYTTKDLKDQTFASLVSSSPWRQNLPEKQDNFGRPKQYEQSKLLRVLNAAVLPGSVRTYRQSEVSQMLDEVYAESGKGNIFPDRSAPYKVDFQKDNQTQKFDLTADDRLAYQQLRGRESYTLYQDLRNDSSFFMPLSAEEKAEVLAEAKGLANYRAKQDFLATQGIEYVSDSYKKLDEATREYGFTVAAYTQTRSMISTDTLPGTDNNGDGKADANSKMYQAIDIVLGLNLTREQMIYILQAEYNGSKQAVLIEDEINRRFG